MSSWNKASKTGQKFHKERAQLKERESLGILEKKKDYKLRALDYQKKHETLKHLKRKALEKNPDEFYFNMTRTEMKDGTHQLRDPLKEYTQEEIMLMKTQDKNYIKMRHQIEMNKVEKLKSTTLFLDAEGSAPPSHKHKFFVEDAGEAKQFDPVKQFNTHEALMGKRSNRLTVDQLEKVKLPSWVDSEYLKEMKKNRNKKQKELSTRLRRLEALRKLELSYDLKPAKVAPEDEYDEKFGIEMNEQQTSKYSKVIPRKK